MSEEQKIEAIANDKIIPPEIPVRSFIDEEELEELTRSIKEVGQIDPIEVRKKGDKYEIINGMMRYLACKRLGKPTINAIIQEGLEDTEVLARRLHANIRVEQDPLGEAMFFQRAIDKFGLTPGLLAPKIKRSEKYIRDRLELLSYPEEVQESLKEKKISLGVAKWLAKVDNERVRKEYLRFAETGGLSVDQAKRWYLSYEKSKAERPPKAEELAETEPAKVEALLKRICLLCGGHIGLTDLEIADVHRSCVEELERRMEEMRKKEEEEKKEE